MFDNLTSKIKDAFRHLTGQKVLTESNTEEALNEIRRALLEADVALPVVRSFIADVKEQALGKEIEQGLNAEQAFLLIVNEALKKALGGQSEGLNLRTQPPAVILMAGLQGAGKTTSVAKLARMLKAERKKVLVVSADVYRPAAIQQLQTLALEIGVDFYPSSPDQDPVEIVTAAKEAARKQFYDVLIVDTAGRLHVDAEMMDEIKRIHAAVNPVETLFTVDAMTGQDAANTAKAFSDQLPLTGVIITKLDGDVRGGAALSVHQISGAPIKFMGVGEKTDALEVFHPERIAQRILDLGDILSLIEKIRTEISEEKQKKLQKKMEKGKFDLNDFLEQIEMATKMGGVSGIMSMLPGMNQLKDQINESEIEERIKRTRSLIQSMTNKERKDPSILKHSRKQRIIKGAGRTIQDLNTMLNEFEQAKTMAKMLSGKGAMSQFMNMMKNPSQLQNMMRMMGGMGGMGGGRRR